MQTRTYNSESRNTPWERIVPTKVQTFPAITKRVVEAGGAVTSDGGVLLLREVDRQLGLTSEVEKRLADARRKKSCAHDIGSLCSMKPLLEVIALFQSQLDLLTFDWTVNVGQFIEFPVGANDDTGDQLLIL